MPAAIRVPPPSQGRASRPARPVVPAPHEPAPHAEDVEELVLRLDDVPIPDVPLHVDGLRPTLGSWLYGLFHRPAVPAKPRKRAR